MTRGDVGEDVSRWLFIRLDDSSCDGTTNLAHYDNKQHISGIEKYSGDMACDSTVTHTLLDPPSD